MKIAIASDHRGYEMKQELINYLKEQNYEVLDLGTNSKESADYPKYGILLGKTIKNKKADLGIALCGTGIGISIACNKVKGIICAKVSNKKEARLAKEHNHANIIALSGEMSKLKTKQIIKTFLTSEENNQEKYIKRINQIKEYENG